MKTDTLIDLLARGAGPAPRAVVARRLLPAVLLGLLASCAAALTVLGGAPTTIYASAAPWIKFLYAGAVAAAAAWLTARWSRPLAGVRGPALTLLAVVVAMAAAAAWLPPGGRAGATGTGVRPWLWCPAGILVLSVPALFAALWALRGLAPTRPAAAGAAAGAMAGALGAIGYALTCSETSAGFVAVWYSAGIAAVALIGALLGPRLLRW
jgi:hypothetical protein